MFETAIAGSLPKPAWLAETGKLWPRWLAEGAGSRLAVWDLAAGAAMPDVAPPAGQVQAMAWSPDSRVLATGLPAGQVELRLAPG